MLTCVTWNTQGSNGVEKSVESLFLNGADVIFLQESAESGDVIGNTYDFQGHTGSHSRPGVLYQGTRARWHGGYQGATSIVLRQNLAMTPSQVIAHPDGISRGVLYTTIQRGLQTLHLCSVHAWSPNGNDWDLIHNNLMSRVIAVAGANPVIVGGDFNQAANRSAVGQWAIPGGSHFGGGSLDGFWLYNFAVNPVTGMGLYGSEKGDHFPAWANINI
ncbi:endonuclease/exonuclease/phosphatase family protein [Pseudomonas syringae]|uniref:endonuclease/exonuclease/phosphatase family protein n=1 Tax=Pseudomonas syringae TaxID=317 RepID=UPI0006A88C1E|nr:endonuclease/exonuclease/phosphatase family protein [Pseudomonas syringae]NYS41688.1 endonuclease/exonuclease/phosphatase family protein [Pseudomonas syringae pv. actinidiae]OSN61400.1 hypothetical protein BV349_04974 [Pseudomonas syringae pv. actinidiae]OSN71470.1 hypothetical protein BV351_04925 [Pseudomonas syringae pv. actinidiae]RMS12424.1 hypothetical protein ALP75_203497 [Pseudomonas syringae pv. actinidiae]GAO92229.1 hypothetical protein PSA5_05950 [Pseudomonas syringae pv. actinidi